MASCVAALAIFDVEGSGSSDEFDDTLNGVIGAMISGFETAVRAMLGIGTMIEAAVGQRSAQALMEEQEQQRDLNALEGEAVSIAGAIALQ